MKCNVIAVATAFSFSAAIPAWGDVMACRPGVISRTFAETKIRIAPHDLPDFERALEKYAERSGLSWSGVGLEDPGPPPLRETTRYLQTSQARLAIIAEWSSASPTARVYIQNNCFAAYEAWRPHWRRFTAFLRQSGYL